MDKDNELILNFINHFTNNGKRDDVIECFTQGCCYWFARILSARFCEFRPQIMYAPVDCHFGCRLNGKIYDITGDVTTSYKWRDWDLYHHIEPSDANRVTQNCILIYIEEDINNG